MSESTLDQIKNRVDSLIQRHRVASEKKSSLSGLLQAKRAELNNLVKEIQEAGLDPKNLRAHRDKLKEELEVNISELDTKLKAVEEALATYETKGK